jgi:hypothetical protein
VIYKDRAGVSVLTQFHLLHLVRAATRWRHYGTSRRSIARNCGCTRLAVTAWISIHGLEVTFHDAPHDACDRYLALSSLRLESEQHLWFKSNKRWLHSFLVSFLPFKFGSRKSGPRELNFQDRPIKSSYVSLADLTSCHQKWGSGRERDTDIGTVLLSSLLCS